MDDLNGHGTHCIGSALGAQQPAGEARRYGCSKSSINVTVLVDEAHRQNMPKVADLKKKGFVLRESLGEIGVWSGSVDKTAVSRLSRVRGVSAVEEERTDYRIRKTSPDPVSPSR